MVLLQKTKYHFVLVHGGCHGAWCWYKLIDRLRNEGHQVTALDMAGAGQHPADPNTIATYEQYNQPLTDFFESLPKEDPSKVVLVGHSLAGLTCMLLMERFSHKIGLVIHVAAVLTPNGVSLNESKVTDLIFKDTPTGKALELSFGEGLDKPPTSFTFFKSQRKETWYTDWSSEDVVLASILVRPYPMRVFGTPITHTEEKYGQVPTVYVKYLRDNTMPIPAQDWIIDNLGPFKEVVELDGGHFDFHLNIDDFTQLVFRLTKNYFAK